MVTNTLAAAIPRIMAGFVPVLRTNAIMAQLVNSSYSEDAGELGSQVDVQIHSDIVALQVAPTNVTPDPAPITPKNVPIAMDQWYEAPFGLTDKDLLEAIAGLRLGQPTKAVESVVNQADVHIANNYVGIYNCVGDMTSGFMSDVSHAIQARKFLQLNRAPMSDARYGVIGAESEARALNLAPFRDVSMSSDPGPIIRGEIGPKVGAFWVVDQNFPIQHTNGTAANTGEYLINGAQTAGFSVDTITIDGVGGTFNAGDLIEIAGDSQVYTVTQAAGANATSLSISPNLQQDAADNAAISRSDGGAQVAGGAGTIDQAGSTYSVELYFHADAFGFANRLFDDGGSELGNMIDTIVDPVSGITLRMEVERQYKQRRWSVDLLWGSRWVRPGLAVRLISPAA